MVGKTRENRFSKWESQVRKGMLEFVVLICLHKSDCYGYELIKTVKELAQIDVSEGTIYPLLNRLKKDGLITSKWVEMDSGIPRKYYHICPQGVEALKGMRVAWNKLKGSIDRLMENQ